MAISPMFPAGKGSPTIVSSLPDVNLTRPVKKLLRADLSVDEGKTDVQHNRALSKVGRGMLEPVSGRENLNWLPLKPERKFLARHA